MESILREIGMELSRADDRRDQRLDRIEQALLLIYGQQLNSERARSLFDTIKFDQDKMQLARLLSQEVKNLAKYREQEARYAGEAPVKLLNLIEETELRIERLKEELKA